MKNKLGWILAIIFGIVLVLALPLVILFGRTTRLTRFGMMYDRGMMDWGYSSMHPFGWGGMLLGWLIAVGVLILIILGIIALIKSLTQSNKPEIHSLPQTPPPPAPVRTCTSCGKLAEPDWNTCPYCGTSLT